MPPTPADERYRTAFCDWVACAVGGTHERAPQAFPREAGPGGIPARVAHAAVAGHVLDFDDTLPDGIAHVSAACAPAALVLAAALELTVADAIAAYAEGFEAMAALAAASHPALYDAGWHPTAVCGPLGAAVAAARLLGLDPEERESAAAIAMLRAGGARGAFGSDGKALQVGLAAAAGVQAAQLAGGGARVDARALTGPMSFTALTGASWPAPAAPGASRWIERNWLKLHPSCLGTHSPIDAALELADPALLDGDGIEVHVHTRGRQAAHLDAVTAPLQGKFSIPYCVAFTLLRGAAPRVPDFGALDPRAASRAGAVRVVVDDRLPDWGAAIVQGGRELARVESPRGAATRPIGPDELRQKVTDLGGAPLAAALADSGRPARALLAAAGLDPA